MMIFVTHCERRLIIRSARPNKLFKYGKIKAPRSFWSWYKLVSFWIFDCNDLSDKQKNNNILSYFESIFHAENRVFNLYLLLYGVVWFTISYFWFMYFKFPREKSFVRSIVAIGDLWVLRVTECCLVQSQKSAVFSLLHMFMQNLLMYYPISYLLYKQEL